MLLVNLRAFSGIHSSGRNVKRQNEMPVTIKKNWGNRPWSIDFHATEKQLPRAVDCAVVGGGFTGLTAAAWLKRLDPAKSVALFETGEFGEGSSGHTGGLALAQTAAGDMPGLGDVLAGYQKVTEELHVHGDLFLPGCYELARTKPKPDSRIRWKDSGELTVTAEVPGGTIDPGKTVTGLARAAHSGGALLFEHTNVDEADARGVELRTSAGNIRANKVLFATNAYSSELIGLQRSARSAFTTALMTEPMKDSDIAELGLADRKPFYTADLPYLWGRLLGNCIIFGAGLVFCKDWRELNAIDIAEGEAKEIFVRLEKRLRGMARPLENVRFTHRWGGPICISDEWKPVFRKHPESEDAIVLGAFSGHGVAQSVYLGAWAAEAMLGRRKLPNWK
jgi:glycine/D-amino acid oxidase-like deaminating enzyme